MTNKQVNPLSAKKITDTPPTPPNGARGIFPKDDGWYDINDNGNAKKIAYADDITKTNIVVADSVPDNMPGNTLCFVCAPKVYGVSIDLTNSDPEAAVTYTDDAVGMTPGSSDWDKTSIFSGVRPCLFKDGSVVGYLNPNDFTKYEDGTDADITSGSSGDVMIEIPKLGYRINTSGNTLTVQVTTNPNADGFCYNAHTRQTQGDREKLYIGAYLGCIHMDSLYSLSGATITCSRGRNDFRADAHARNIYSGLQGYDMIGFYQMILLQCLFLIKYKNRDSQAALGNGYLERGEYGNYDQSGNPLVAQTGGTNANGMYYGSKTSASQQVKFLGIEDIWGNAGCIIDGLNINSDYRLYTATNSFNNGTGGYTDRGIWSFTTSAGNGYIKIPYGTNELGFLPKEGGGSNSTYFSDIAAYDPYGFQDGSVCAIWGRRYSALNDDGIFGFDIGTTSTDMAGLTSTRLMYL